MQQLRRIDGTARYNDLPARCDAHALAVLFIRDTHRAWALEQNPRHMGMRFHFKILAAHRRTQESPRRRHPAAALGGELIEAHTFLPGAVEVGVILEAGGNRRRDEGLAQRMRVIIQICDMQRTAGAAKGRITRRIIFHPLVSRQHVVPAPADISAAFPVLVILGSSTDIDHGVDRG